MKTGPPPTPTALRVMKGNPSRRPLPVGEAHPTVVNENIAPPDWMADDAKTEWRRLAPMLARNGLLTDMDLDALVAYCHAWCVWKDANRRIREGGMVVTAKNGFPMQSPYLPIANKAMLQMQKLMVEFGMTPSSRTRVARGDAAPAANPLDRFVNRKRS